MRAVADYNSTLTVGGLPGSIWLRLAEDNCAQLRPGQTLRFRDSRL